MAGNIFKLLKYRHSNCVSYRGFFGKDKGQPLDNDDIMGLPDTKSNLRALKIGIPANESREENEYRTERERLQRWNQEYWEKHNDLFKTEKDLFVKNELEKMGQEKRTLNSEEMAVFYKDFLNKNHDKHVRYNWEWYGKNFRILWLSFKAELSKISRK